jgi:hypothetical protein
MDDKEIVEEKVFDRTGLNLSPWLPWSRRCRANSQPLLWPLLDPVHVPAM